MPQHDQSCASCWFFRPTDALTDVFGACHRSHPDPSGSWPSCRPEDWCGRWSDIGKFDTAPTIPVSAPKGDPGPPGQGVDPGLTNYRVAGITPNGGTNNLAAVPIANNVVIILDGKIRFVDNASKLTGGFIRLTQAFTRFGGVLTSLGAVVVVESRNLPGPSCDYVMNGVTNSIDIVVTGLSGTPLSWNGLFVADRG